MSKKERPFGVTSAGEKLAYAVGDLGSNFVWTFCSSFLTMYYTDSVLISAGLIGTIMLIARIFDGVSDIFAGMIIENTKTKYGKARPWFGGSMIPLVIIQFLVFNVPGTISTGAKIAWIVVTYFLLTVVAYTINNLSYHAMLSRISLTSDDRNKVSSIRGIFSFIAGLALAIITPKLLAANGGEKVQGAWTKTALVFGVLCLVFEAICFFGTKEKISCFDEDGTKKENANLKEGVNELLKTKYFYISVLTFICAYILNTLTLSTAVYFARDVFGNADLYSLIAIVSILAAVVVMAFSPKIFAKAGKRKTLMVSAVVGAVGCAIGLVGAKSVNASIVLVATAINGAALAPYVSAIFTFAPDIITYLEKKMGVRYEGLVTSVNSVGTKLGTGLAAGILGWGLSLGHYDGALATQPASALNAEIILLYAVPFVCNILMLVLMNFWDIDSKIAE